MTLSIEIVVIGILTGLTYAVLAAGLVLVYRATKVINFAYGEMGALGAAILAKVVLDLNWNYLLTFALMLLFGAVLGGVIELTIIRRLFYAPRLILLVATIGAAQLLFVLQFVVPEVDRVSRYPAAIDRTMNVGNLLLRGEHFMVIAFVPASIVGLAFFLGRTPWGIAIRAAAENADAARLAGISAKRVSTLVWALSGALGTATVILISPIRGVVVGLPQPALGPGLLLRALAAALVGRLVSFPLALAGGLVVGLVEAVLFVNVGTPGFVDFILFAAVLGLVLFRRRGEATDEEGTWSLAPKIKPIPARLLAIPWVRRLPYIGWGAAALIAIVLPFFFPRASQLFFLGRMLLFAMVALSLTVLTGWAGQLSLGQFAFVGVGSMVTYALGARGMPFGIAVFYATVAGVLAALAIGAPALRLRGLLLAVTTLAFAVAAWSWLLPHRIFTGGQSVVTVTRGELFGLDLRSPRAYYYLCLVVLAAALAATSRLRRSGVGRAFVAVRDNEQAAASFTVSPAIVKLTAFAVSGGIAALAGGLLAGLRVQFGPDAFGPQESLRAVAMAIIGGIGSVAGAVLGAVYVTGLPAIFQDSLQVRFLTSGIGLLVLLLYFPGGLVQMLYAARDAILAAVERRLPEAAAPAPEPPRVTVSRNGDRPEAPEGVVLAARDVLVRFGGLVALDGVSIEARAGEVVGLIGSNGAGKSTLMNVVSGFIRPDAGRVELLGTDVTELAPHERARLGLGRVFQDARLFGDLTVREAIQVALEARERSEVVPSMLGLPPAIRAEQRKSAEASDLLGFLGLGRYEQTFISDLSTGTRRIAELACLIALDARVLLLDEPTAGVAQREAEAFGPLIKRIQHELGATLVVIEHDIPLVMSLSDRVYCLAAGSVIAEGLPEDVRNDPSVIAAYLGTDERAIQRSDARRIALQGERA